MAEHSLEAREAKVQHGHELVLKLKDIFIKAQADGTLSNWINQIAALETRAEKSTTILGVVGNTGAGKSSLINAVLDEKKLLPTSCWKACTAAPCEVSYNHSDDPDERYRAEVEFLSPDEWKSQLNDLWDDMSGEDGVPRPNIDTYAQNEAGAALKFLQIVYPGLDKFNIRRTNVDELMEVEEVTDVLGTTIKFEDRTGNALYDKIRKYLTSIRDRSVPFAPKEMEYYPMVKVVKVFAKAEALSTGAILVDLPGGHDSNAARAAVAEKYRKNCTGMWIVSHINRAVDDATVKKWLDDSLKHQLQMDGIYDEIGTLAFICTRTDDINVAEARDAFNIQDDEEEEPEDAGRNLPGEKDKLVKKMRCLQHDSRKCHTQLTTYRKLAKDLKNGKTVYPPKPARSSDKRKTSDDQSGARKRTLYQSAFSFLDDALSYDAEPEDELQQVPEPTTEPLTQKKVDEIIGSLDAEKTRLLHEVESTQNDIWAIEDEIFDLESASLRAVDRLTMQCIEARNLRCKEAIRSEYATGRRDLDEEAAEYDENYDPDTQDPSTQQRDYEGEAKKLPVFCVSSKAYMGLLSSGFDNNNSNTLSAFRTGESTGITLLQEYTRKVTLDYRENRVEAYLASYQTLVNSLRMWIGEVDDDVQEEEDEGADSREVRLKRHLEALRYSFTSEVIGFKASFVKSLEELIFEFLDESVERAEMAAPAIVAKWNAHHRDGGLHWSTYRATAKRDGTWKGLDMNEELAKAIVEKLPARWNLHFKNIDRRIVEPAVENIKQRFEAFHEQATGPTMVRKIRSQGLALLGAQLQPRIKTIELLPKDVKKHIDTEQREVNREFVEGIKQEMSSVYEELREIRGQGSWARMRKCMADHADDSGIMFQEVADHVRARLEKMADNAEKSLNDRVDAIFNSIAQDYQNALIGDAGAKEDQLRIKVSGVLFNHHNPDQVKKTPEIVDNTNAPANPVPEQRPAQNQAISDDGDAQVKAEDSNVVAPSLAPTTPAPAAGIEHPHPMVMP